MEFTKYHLGKLPEKLSKMSQDAKHDPPLVFTAATLKEGLLECWAEDGTPTGYYHFTAKDDETRRETVFALTPFVLEHEPAVTKSVGWNEDPVFRSSSDVSWLSCYFLSLHGDYLDGLADDEFRPEKSEIYTFAHEEGISPCFITHLASRHHRTISVEMELLDRRPSKFGFTSLFGGSADLLVYPSGARILKSGPRKGRFNKPPCYSHSICSGGYPTGLFPSQHITGEIAVAMLALMLRIYETDTGL